MLALSVGSGARRSISGLASISAMIDCREASYCGSLKRVVVSTRVRDSEDAALWRWLAAPSARRHRPAAHLGLVPLLIICFIQRLGIILVRHGCCVCCALAPARYRGAPISLFVNNAIQWMWIWMWICCGVEILQPLQQSQHRLRSRAPAFIFIARASDSGLFKVSLHAQRAFSDSTAGGDWQEAHSWRGGSVPCSPPTLPPRRTRGT